MTETRQSESFPRNLKKEAIEFLEARGVTLKDIAQLVYDLQMKYIEDLDFDLCLESVDRVLDKREVQNAVLTGISLDKMGDAGNLPESLLRMLRIDDGLYGIDEIMALSIVNIYGSIGFTNFGYLDKAKPGIIGKVNRQRKQVNTFLDDLVAAIAAAAASRIAHRDRDELIREMEQRSAG